MKLSSPVSGAVMDFSPFDTRTEAEPATHEYGACVALNDGREYRHAKAGGSNISRAKLQLAPAPKANHQDVAVASDAAVGAGSVTVTLGATAAVAGEYDQGFLAVIDGTGEGQVLSIGHNPAADSAASLEVSLADDVQVALDNADSKAALIHNTWNGVVEGTSGTRAVAGVPQTDISSGDFGWLQTKGVATVLADEALTVGARVTAGTSTAGSVEEIDDVTAPLTENEIGFVQHAAGTDTEYPVVVLTID